MKLYVGYHSALAYWRAHPLDPARSRTARRVALAHCAANLKQVTPFACERFGIGTEPTHVLAARAAQKNTSQRIVCHLRTDPLPAGSFAIVDEDLLVASPELVFVQMAHTLSFATLVELGHELCGSYRLSENAPDGFTQAVSLTSSAKLRAYAARMGSARGAKRAAKAALYVADGSASPRETHCSELLCLPHSMGGYGFALPRMNCEVDVASQTPHGTMRKRLRCDLYWPKHRLAVEYESDLYHTGEANIARDSKRRSKLGGEGVFVVTVTNDQIKSILDFDEVARLLAKHMDMRLRIRVADFRARQLRLRTELLGKRH